MWPLRWTRKTIIEEIKRLKSQGVELNYTSAEANHLNLVRAAAWHFGTWRRAVESSGIDYESLSKYRRWDQQRIIQRILDLHHEGADLSWRAVSLEVDPPLAAAALRPNGFASWRDAIAAAGLDINLVARYQSWNADRIVKEIKKLHKQSSPLSSKAMQSTNQPLFCAGRRKFGSWDDALRAAGLNVDKIRLRQPKVPMTTAGLALTKAGAKRTAVAARTDAAPRAVSSRRGNVVAPPVRATVPVKTAGLNGAQKVGVAKVAKATTKQVSPAGKPGPTAAKLGPTATKPGPTAVKSAKKAAAPVRVKAKAAPKPVASKVVARVAPKAVAKVLAAAKPKAAASKKPAAVSTPKPNAAKPARKKAGSSR